MGGPGLGAQVLAVVTIAVMVVIEVFLDRGVAPHDHNDHYAVNLPNADGDRPPGAP